MRRGDVFELRLLRGVGHEQQDRLGRVLGDGRSLCGVSTGAKKRDPVRSGVPDTWGVRSCSAGGLLTGAVRSP